MAISRETISASSTKDQTSKESEKIKHGKAFPLIPKPNKYRDALPKPEDLEKFRLVPADEPNLGLWEQAWERVKKEEDGWK